MMGEKNSFSSVMHNNLLPPPLKKKIGVGHYAKVCSRKFFLPSTHIHQDVRTITFIYEDWGIYFQKLPQENYFRNCWKLGACALHKWFLTEVSNERGIPFKKIFHTFAVSEVIQSIFCDIEKWLKKTWTWFCNTK